jgi:hypothetical protein
MDLLICDHAQALPILPFVLLFSQVQELHGTLSQSDSLDLQETSTTWLVPTIHIGIMCHHPLSNLLTDIKEAHQRGTVFALQVSLCHQG